MSQIYELIVNAINEIETYIIVIKEDGHSIEKKFYETSDINNLLIKIINTSEMKKKGIFH